MAHFYTNNDPWKGELKIKICDLSFSDIDELVKVCKNISYLAVFDCSG